MLSSLTLLLAEQELRPQLIADCVELIESQVKSKKGIMGIAINKGFTSVSKLKQGQMIEKVVNMLLDDFIAALEPYYQSYRHEDASNRGDFADYLVARDEQVTMALLAVTDRKRASANSKVLILVYDKMRKVANKHIKQAIPELGQLIQTYSLRTCAK